MSLPTTASINIRSDGSSTQCAGGFNSARGGTDYTLQAAAQATGIVTSSTTTVTATTAIFTSDMVGNYITDGTTFKEITAFTSSTVVTVDSAPSWTAATIYVGGALATPAKAAALAVAGNIVNLKNGTYTITTVIAPTNTSTNVLPIIWQGYNVTPGDLVATSPPTNAPLITTATNSTSILSGVTSSQGNTFFRNINFSNTASVRAAFGVNSTNIAYGYLVACKLTGFAGLNNSSGAGGQHYNCEFASFTAAIFSTTSGSGLIFDGCWAHDGTDLIATTNGNGVVNPPVIKDCIISNMTGWVINSTESFSSQWIVENTSVFACAGGFIQVASTNDSTRYNRIHLKNNIVWGAAGSKVIKNNDTNGRTQLITLGVLALGGQTTPYTNITAPSTDIAITADPFTASGSNDYSLNSTASAGASCKATGFPGVLGSTTGYRDLGAVQSVGSSGKKSSVF